MTTPAAAPAAVLWDMDGTLVDSEPLWDVSLTELARHLGGELPSATREAMLGHPLEANVALMFATVGLAPDPDALAEAARWLRERTGQLFARRMDWRPGAQAALRAVRAAGLPTALVTSTARELTEHALVTIGREHFDAVVCGDEVAEPKPAPDVYLRAAALLGVAPGRCVAVEDSPAGVSAAAAAGCAVLVVPSGPPVPRGPGRVHRADLVGLTVGELAGVLSAPGRAAGSGPGRRPATRPVPSRPDAERDRNR